MAGNEPAKLQQGCFFPFFILIKYDLLLFPMKIFAFIMGIIILIMSCIPCKDAPVYMKSKNTQNTFSLAVNHTHEEAGDDCSPLCSCACCSAHSCPQSFYNTVGHTPAISLTHASVYTGSLISVSLPIWQPPQLVA